MSIFNKIKLFIPFLLFTFLAHGENLYVRSGASGSNNGSDWNNAWATFSAISWGSGTGQVGPGDTIWVAGGTYTGPFEINGQGTSGNRLFIKRALASESACTSAAGWSASYDSTVTINGGPPYPLGFVAYAENGNGSYVTIDGGVAYSGFTIALDHRNSSGYHPNSGGLNIHNANSGGLIGLIFRNARIYAPYHDTVPAWSDPPGTPNAIDLMNLGAPSAGTAVHRDILIEYVEMDHCSNGPHLSVNDGIIFQYCKFHHINQTASNAEGGAHSNIIYAHIERGQYPKNFTFRYNQIYSTWCEGIHPGCDSSNCAGSIVDGWRLYGNLIYDIEGDGTSKIFQWQSASATIQNVLIAYNTFANADYPAQYPVALGGDVAGQRIGAVHNNVIWNFGRFGYISSGPSSYNFYAGASSGLNDANDTGNIQNYGAGNPFVNSGTDDYRLLAQTTAGLPLGSPYDLTDLLGNARTFPTRGAYEFGGSPAAPTIVSNNITGTNGISLIYHTIATGNPSTYDATNLPPGLVINTATGIITGTPTQTETNRVVGLMAQNGTGTTWQTVLATIHPIAGTLWVSSGYITDFGRQDTNSLKQVSVIASNSGPSSTTLSVTFTNVTGSTFSILNGYTQANLTGTNVLVAVLQSLPTAVGTNLGNVRIIADGNYTNNLLSAARPVFTSTNAILTNALILPPMVATTTLGVTVTNILGNATPNGVIEYSWDTSVAGTLSIWMSVLATNQANDSAYVTIDDIPSSPTNIWDVLPYPAYFTNQSYVHWRGGGSYGSPEFSNKVWTVSAGRHVITIAGRETYLFLSEANIVFTSTGGSDTTPPTVTIQYPTNGTAMTVSSSQFTGFAGIASDNNALLSVIVTNVGRGVTYTPTGTTTWTNGTISLFNGLNTLKVIATDTNSNTGSDTLDVYFNVPSRSIGRRFLFPH